MATTRKGRRPRRRRERLGRNDVCWCGSGRKYKICHLDRATQTPIQPWEASKKFKQAFSAEICLVPEAWQNECKGRISQAHTVPKSGSLKRIARKGHVYSFDPSLENLRKNQGKLVPKLFGIRKASTFTGFCARHDSVIFAPLEQQKFCGTSEQCFLLGYRALAREFYTKRAATRLQGLYRDKDKGKTPAEQGQIQSMAQLHNIGLKAALQDTDHYKSLYDGLLESREYKTVRAYIIEFETAPPVMCSGAVYPEQDFGGVKLQDVADIRNTPDLLCFTSFHGGERGAVAFSWLVESDRTCRAFVESLRAIPNEFVTAALSRFFFTHCENVHIEPDWWESLSEETRNAVIERVKESADPIEARPKAVLADDGVAYDPWPIISRWLVE